MKNIAWVLVGLSLTGSAYAQGVAKGTVYVDANGNGQKDRKEVGLAGVGISNGVDVVQTDKNGKYEIPVQNDNIIFAIKPADYSFPLDEFNQPKFYYTYKPQGSPKLKFEAVQPTGKLPKSIDFAVVETEEESEFTAFVFGDPQAYNEDELEFFKKGVVDDAKTVSGPLFGISLGDLVGNDLSLHPAYKRAMTEMSLPWYHVIGNHDLNFDVQVDSLSDETFEKNFGPANYSFNVGRAHFLILDDIIYPHPTTGKGYQGGFRKSQLDFIENDLRTVSKDKLVVLSLHIPLNPTNSASFRDQDRQRLFDILAEFPNIVTLSAHTHYQQQNFYDQVHGWKGGKPLHEYNVGTTSGDWYSGQLTEKGIPVSTMRDGTPKGYAILKINGNQYSFTYKVVGEDADYGLAVFGPSTVYKKYVRRYPLYVNFFMGAADDEVRYQIDGGEWKKMEHVEAYDPAYLKSVLEFDGATSLRDGRRPSDPVSSRHLWRTKLPKLKGGKHQIKIEATDMYGKVYSSVKQLEVVE
ncbi:MAG: calcineurin-like phosphoesterase C-terminal domain-containing protein [Sphingobacterium sp.]